MFSSTSPATNHLGSIVLSHAVVLLIQMGEERQRGQQEFPRMEKNFRKVKRKKRLILKKAVFPREREKKKNEKRKSTEIRIEGCRNFKNTLKIEAWKKTKGYVK